MIAAKQAEEMLMAPIGSSVIQTETVLVLPSPVSPVAPRAVAEGVLVMWAAETWFQKRKTLHSVKMTVLLSSLLHSCSNSRGFWARQNHVFQTMPGEVD